MKNRAVFGGIAVAAVILATFFTGIIPGLGDGHGSGDEATSVQVGITPPDSEAPVTADATGPNPTDAARPDVETPAPSEPAGPPPELIQVVVDHFNDKDRYGLQLADGRYKVVEMSEVLEQARLATGDEDGIKVRILRKASAKVVAWSTLKNELENSGISPASILMPKKLVD